MLPRSGAVSDEHSVGLEEKKKRTRGGREMLRGGTQGKSEEGTKGRGRWTQKQTASAV